jgi:mRNA interferase MazF
LIDPVKNPRRGEVWRVEFEPSRGAEIRKTRPAVVMNVATAGKLALRVIVPLTGWQAPFERVFWHVRIEPNISNGLDKVSSADAFQVRSLSIERFVDRMGELNSEQIAAIAQAVSVVVGRTL